MSRTVLNIIPDQFTTALQDIEKNPTTIKINDAAYQIIHFEGFKPSKFLESQSLSQSQDIKINFKCDRRGNVYISQELNDSIFLLVAYSITKVDELNIDELLCLVDAASILKLQIDTRKLFEAAKEKVNDANQLFLFINSLATLNPKATDSDLLNNFCQLAVQVLNKQGNDPQNFELVSQALIFSLPWKGKDNYDWKSNLYKNFGQTFFVNKNIPFSLMGSYFVNMADKLLNASSFFYSNVVMSQENAPIELSQVTDWLLQENEKNGLLDEFQDRVQIMYNDLSQTIEDMVRSISAQHLATWFIRSKLPINVDLIFGPGSITSSFPNLEFNPVNNEFFYSVPAQVISTENFNKLYYSLPVPEFVPLIEKSRRIIISFTPSALRENYQTFFARSGIDFCVDPSVLSYLKYPFFIMPSFNPLEFTQYSDCVIATDLNALAKSAIKNPALITDLYNLGYNLCAN